MAARLILFLVIAAVGIVASAGQEPSSDLVGRWQYIQAPDTEGEVLDLVMTAGHLRGIMNGLERAGEHGLFYYVVEVNTLVIAPDGSVGFEVGDRSFFTKRPTLSILGGEGDGGVSHESMRFDGRLEGGDLILRCRNPGGSCPDATLRLKRISAALEPNQPFHATPDGARERKR